jgi:hypothetical protein
VAITLKSAFIELLRRVHRLAAANERLEPEPLASLDPAVLNGLKERKVDGLWYLLYAPDHPQQQVYDLVWRVQRAELERIVTAMGEAQVPVLLFKGAELYARNLANRPINISEDSDFLVPRQKIAAAKRTLFALGYKQGILDPTSRVLRDADMREVAAFEANHYETWAFQKIVRVENVSDEIIATVLQAPPDRIVWAKGNTCEVLVEVDPHFQVATDIPPESFFERMIPSVFPGAMTFSHADHLWFIASRLYNEVALQAKTTLRDFAYIVSLVEAGGIDWEVVMQMADTFGLHASLYYYITIAGALSTKGVPKQVLAHLSPVHKNRSRDWGWQFDKLVNEVARPPLGVAPETP